MPHPVSTSVISELALSHSTAMRGLARMGGEDAGGAGGECGERVGEDVWDLIRTCFGENMVDVDGVLKCS